MALVLLMLVAGCSAPHTGVSATSASQVSVPNLTDGACLDYAPTSRDLGKTVFVDAGHGGPDSGGVGPSVKEKDATLAVAIRLRDLLLADGYRVVLSRTKDSSAMNLAPSDLDGGLMTADAVRRDLETRIACANTAGATVLVSIHFNANDDPSVAGSQAFFNPQRDFASSNKRLAQDLQSAVVSGLGSTDHGVWTDDQVGSALSPAGAAYGHLILLGPASPGFVDEPSQMPGALVEPLFVTNANDVAVISDPRGQQRIARALESGVLNFASA